MKKPIFDSTTRTVENSAIGDHPAETDLLGFEPYVTSMADFLTAAATQPPLTVSIEGSWGSGKSSFMRQLEKELMGRGYPTVDFNAWRHDRSEELWTAFATRLLRSLSSKAPWRRRVQARLRLSWDRIDRLTALALGIRLIVSGVLIVWSGYVIVTEIIPLSFGDAQKLFLEDGRINIQGLVGVAGSAGIAILLMVLLTDLHRRLGDPLLIRLEEYQRRPAYENHTSFLEDFHLDLNRMVKIYSDEQRVFVFVDDLDRASLIKAAGLMQAINLMISESSKLVFIPWDGPSEDRCRDRSD